MNNSTDNKIIHIAFNNNKKISKITMFNLWKINLYFNGIIGIHKLSLNSAMQKPDPCIVSKPDSRRCDEGYVRNILASKSIVWFTKIKQLWSNFKNVAEKFAWLIVGSHNSGECRYNQDNGLPSRNHTVRSLFMFYDERESRYARDV